MEKRRYFACEGLNFSFNIIFFYNTKTDIVAKFK